MVNLTVFFSFSFSALASFYFLPSTVYIHSKTDQISTHELLGVFRQTCESHTKRTTAPSRQEILKLISANYHKFLREKELIISTWTVGTLTSVFRQDNSIIVPDKHKVILYNQAALIRLIAHNKMRQIGKTSYSCQVFFSS